MRFLSTVFAASLALSAALVSPIAAATAKYQPSVQPNPPPSVPLASFDRVEVNTLTLSPEFDGQKPNIAAKDKIQINLNTRLSAWVLTMNSRTTTNESPRTLVITPRIEKIKFIGTGARLWAGALAGSSQVLLKVTMTDKATGEIVAAPEFYQKANAWAGAYSAGGHDHDMLSRIADLVANYLNTNLEAAVGGPTGAEEPAK